MIAGGYLSSICFYNYGGKILYRYASLVCVFFFKIYFIYFCFEKKKEEKKDEKIFEEYEL